jgi:hypothetical protein
MPDTLPLMLRRASMREDPPTSNTRRRCHGPRARCRISSLQAAEFQAKPAYNAVASILRALGKQTTEPQISPGGVVIHAGNSSTVSPGSLFDVYGTGLAASPSSAPGSLQILPLAIDSVQVLVNGTAAPLLIRRAKPNSWSDSGINSDRHSIRGGAQQRCFEHGGNRYGPAIGSVDSSFLR